MISSGVFAHASIPQPLGPDRLALWVGGPVLLNDVTEERVEADGGDTGMVGVFGLLASAFVVHAQNTPVWEGQLDEVNVSRGKDLGSGDLHSQR